MSISIICQDCSSKYSVPEEHAGKRTKCKKCGSLISIPAQTAADSDPGPEPPARPAREKAAGRGQRSGSGRTRRARGEDAEPAGPALPPPAIIAALVTAIVGAGAWLLILMKFDLEIGWLAIGIGAATGAAMVKFGGRGVVAGVVASVLAGVAIIGGRVGGLNLIFDRAVSEVASSAEFDDEFKEIRSYGREVREMEHPLSIATVTEYAAEFQGESDEPMTASEIAEFKDQMLQWEAYAEKGGYQIYKDEVETAIKEEVSTGDLLKEAFGPKDLLFLALALAAAFGMVRSKD